MKAVAYIRVSTDEQVKNSSLDSQEAACKQFAKENGLDLPPENIFREEGVSGTHLNRPELTAMLTYCAANKGKISTCIILRIDRLSRDSTYYHVIRSQLNKYGVSVRSTSEVLGDDPFLMFGENIISAAAQLENDIRKLRCTTGMISRSKQGAWIHEPPKGYKRIRTPSKIPTIEPNEDAENVAKLLEEFSKGFMSVSEAKQFAVDLGLIEREKTNWQLVKNILINPIYAGIVFTKFTEGEKITGLHKPLVSKETHYKILEIMITKKRGYKRVTTSDWALRGFLKHTCGKALTGSSPRGNGGAIPRYACPECKFSITKSPVSKQRDAVHSEFIKLLETIKPSEEVVSLFKEVVIKKWNDSKKDIVTLKANASNELDSIKQSKAKLLNLYLENKVADAVYEEKSNDLDMQELEYSSRLASYTDETLGIDSVINDAISFITNPHLFWNKADLQIKKAIQDVVFPEGLSFDFESGFGTIKLSESYQLIKEISISEDSENALVAATGIEPVTLGL